MYLLSRYDSFVKIHLGNIFFRNRFNFGKFSKMVPYRFSIALIFNGIKKPLFYFCVIHIITVSMITRNRI